MASLGGNGAGPAPRHAACAALFALAACAIEPNGPTLRITGAEPHERVQLRWLPPTRGVYSGFRVEVRHAGRGFEAVAETSWTQLWVDLSGARQGSDVELRVRALPDPAGDRASNVVTHHVAIRPPTLWCTNGCAPSDGALSLSIAPSPFALALARRVVDCTGAASPWIALPLAGGAPTYLDADLRDWTDGAVLEYRLTASAGADVSEPTILRSLTAAPSPPAAMVAAPVDGGTLVSFESASRCAVVMNVLYEPSHVLAARVPVVPGPGTAGSVVLTPAFPVYAYSAEARLASVETAAPRSTWTLAPGVGSPDWNASLAEVAPGTRVARLPSGEFATADGARVHAPGPDGPDVLVSPGTIWSLAADGTGAVHALLSSGASLVHAEHDAAGWREEVVGASPSSPYAEAALAVSLDGTVFAAWRSGWDLEVATRRGGTWSVDPIVGLFAGTFRAYALAADGVGAPHVAVDAGTVIHHWSWGAAGWERETLPIDSRGMIGFCGTSDALIVAYTRASVSSLDAGHDLIERTAAGWGAPEPVTAFPAYVAFSTTCSRHGARIAMSSFDGVVALRDPSGTVVRSWPRMGGYGIGFGPDGKAWILENLWNTVPASGVPAPAVLLEEP